MRSGHEDMGARHEDTKTAKVFGIALDVEIIIVALVVLAFVFPRLFGFVPDVVLSPSMSPTIPAGSVAYVNCNADTTALSEGDVAVYRLGDAKQVMHRVTSVGEEGYTFKGDANSEADAHAVAAGEVVGTYMFHIPEIGWAYVWFDDNRALVIVALLAANLAAYSLVCLSRHRATKASPEEGTAIAEVTSAD